MSDGGNRDENDVVRRLADGEDPWVIDPEHGCTNPLTGYFPSAEVEREKRRRREQAEFRDVTPVMPVRLGSFKFTYNESRSEMYVERADETAEAMAAVTREDWEDFRREALRAIEHEPEVTVELKSVQIVDHEVDQAGWEVVLSGPRANISHGTWTSREYATAVAQDIAESLRNILGDDHVELDLLS